MSFPNQVPVQIQSKASISSKSGVQQPPSDPNEALSRSGFHSRTANRRSGLQPVDGDYVPYYDRVYKPPNNVPIDATRPAGISSIPQQKVQQQIQEQQYQEQAYQQMQQHSVAEPTGQQQPYYGSQAYYQQPTTAAPTNLQAEVVNQPHQHYCGNQVYYQQPQQQQQQQQYMQQATQPQAQLTPQTANQQQKPTGSSTKDDEFVTKCPNCCATLVLSPQCPPGQQPQPGGVAEAPQ